mmetsp:Transcript_36514/g.60486  ORF Transcript_36514/g.60486 Transcript_36514/m.60486 type:complete len:192 (+) Transcript_36514:59-634(+)|eukprot:CAMPEP_0119329698 /NCGR_PEP_ID=MMETSP1333-20130426/76493_1 /TAXON_ID=418940 /ORGANISM="Scyphosphaera apsteinii, Strain RCC1455" /LENGTH=191 /DNA_ID=CAMNT_0007338887 /DNA_START=37 /DNA_END=612 /DNA_ORIENTATION=+
MLLVLLLTGLATSENPFAVAKPAVYYRTGGGDQKWSLQELVSIFEAATDYNFAEFGDNPETDLQVSRYPKFQRFCDLLPATWGHELDQQPPQRKLLFMTMPIHDTYRLDICRGDSPSAAQLVACKQHTCDTAFLRMDTNNNGRVGLLEFIEAAAQCPVPWVKHSAPAIKKELEDFMKTRGFPEPSARTDLG